MKTTLLAFAFMLSVQTNAQTITSTSSAEDAISFIKNIAKTYIGKGQDEIKLENIEFDGINFIAFQDYPLAKRNNTYANINWAEFKGIQTVDKPEAQTTFVILNFNKKILRKSDGVMKNGAALLNPRFTEQNYLSFNIPQSENNKLKELEAAANRLSQIAKANGSGLLAVVDRKVPDEGKPTYEQTAEYIKSYFDNENKKQHERIRTMWYSRGYLESLSYKILYVEIAGCTLYIGYEVLKTNHFHKTEERSSQSHEIDISQIEDIKVTLIGQHDAEIKQQHFVNNLSFKVKYQSTEMMLPFDIIAANAENNGKETQIYKAFNHLRKLCGAPEPVTFE